MRFSMLAAMSMLVAVAALAQTRTDLSHQATNADFSAFPHTRPVQVGAVLPSGCSVGEMFFRTTDNPGNNLYLATSSSPCVWTQIAGTSASSAGLPVAVDTGIVNAYTGCPAGSPPLADGMTVVFMARVANLGASKFAYCGGTALPLVNPDQSALAAGSVVPWAPYNTAAAWNPAAPVQTLTVGSTYGIGDIAAVFTDTPPSVYISLKAQTYVNNDRTDPAKWAKIAPASNFLVYHAGIASWELKPAVPKTAAYPPSQSDVTSYVSPSVLIQSLNNLSPIASPAPNTKFQFARSTGSTWLPAGNPQNPGAGRMSRAWVADGVTPGLSQYRMALSAANCGTATRINSTGVGATSTPFEASYPTNGTASTSNCFLTTGTVSMFSAGNNLMFDAGGVVFSASTTINNVLGLAWAGADVTALSHSTGSYGGAVAFFRYSATMSDARFKCVVSASSSDTPMVVDTGAIGGTVLTDGNPHRYSLWIDDAASTMHWYIDSTEVCTGQSWGIHLPGGSQMTPFVGTYQTAAFSSAQTVAASYVYMEADK